jgi:hypothetical protein
MELDWPGLPASLLERLKPPAPTVTACTVWLGNSKSLDLDSATVPAPPPPPIADPPAPPPPIKRTSARMLLENVTVPLALNWYTLLFRTSE